MAIEQKRIQSLNRRGIGITLPLISNSGRLFDLSYSTEDQMISNVKNLVLTNPGERYMQPTFGCGLLQLQFENITDELFERVATIIQSNIQYWLPYVNIVELDIQEVDGIGISGLQIILTVSLGDDESGIPINFTLTNNSITSN